MKAIMKHRGEFYIINVEPMTEDLLRIYPSATLDVYILDSCAWYDTYRHEITKEEADSLTDFSDAKTLGTSGLIYLIDNSKMDIVKELEKREPYWITAEKTEAEQDKIHKMFVEKKIQKAINTGKPVLIESGSLPEHMTPLWRDHEDDIVTCRHMAMPDGSTKWEYSHNY